MDPVTEYARKVCESKVVACKYVRQACERHLFDLQRNDLRWDEKEAQLACEFFPKLLRHYKGPMAGKPFELSLWEKFIVGSAFGWKRLDGLRRFRELWVEIPRKNGKSTLASGVALLMFLFDSEPGAEVYTVATKEDQAKIVWDTSRVMVNLSRPLKNRVRVLHNTMHYDRAFSVFRPLGRDSKTQDGLNPSCAVGDEVHAWPDASMYEVIDSAFGSRSQPIFFLITTAGQSRECFCYKHREHVINVLDGYESDYQDDQVFGFIATIDEGDDPFDEANWYKANPELGHGKQLDYMRGLAAKARQLPSAKNNFLTKQLNVWIESASTWMPLNRWDACRRKIDWNRYAGLPVYGGLDLASSTDFAACSWIFVEDGVFTLLPQLWLPEKAVEDNRRLRDKRVLNTIRRWIDKGLVSVTPGDWIDYDFIQTSIEDTAKKYRIQEIGYDPYNAGNLPNKLEEKGITCTAIGQGFKHMNPAAKEFERRVLSERLLHDGHPAMRWMLGNVLMKEDPNGNIRPDKSKSHEKIDGVVATLMALNRAMDAQKQDSVYNSRGIRTV